MNSDRYKGVVCAHLLGRLYIVLTLYNALAPCIANSFVKYKYSLFAIGHRNKHAALSGKVTKYCSATCQKDHFALHKKDCKSISKKRMQLEKEWAEENEGPTNFSFSITRQRLTNQGCSHLLMSATVEFADSILKMGYRESDTIEHSGVYYREALKYYLIPMLALDEDSRGRYKLVEERILLMLVVLGGDDGTIQEWCWESGGSERMLNWHPADHLSDIAGLADQFDLSDIAVANGGDLPKFEMAGYAVPKEITFQMLMMLSLMKLMATYRKNMEGLEVYKKIMQHTASSTHNNALSSEDLFNHISPFLMGEKHNGKVELEVLPERIQNVISAIRYHGNESYLVHLRDSIPYTRAHAPNLFSGIDELWMLYQDCFFETPGLNDVLHEFLPEVQVQE